MSNLGENQLTCLICYDKFTSLRALQEHIRVVHSRAGSWQLWRYLCQISELINELQQKVEVLKEKGFNPDDVYVYVPDRESETAFSPANLPKLDFIERGTMVDLIIDAE